MVLGRGSDLFRFSGAFSVNALKSLVRTYSGSMCLVKGVSSPANLTAR